MWNFEIHRTVKIETILKDPDFVLEDINKPGCREGWAFLRYLPYKVHEDGVPYGFYIKCKDLETTKNLYLTYGEINMSGHPFMALVALYEKFGVLWCDDPQEPYYERWYVKDNEWQDFIYGICADYMVRFLQLEKTDNMYMSLQPLLEKYEEIEKTISDRHKQFKFIFRNWWYDSFVMYITHPKCLVQNIKYKIRYKFSKFKRKHKKEDDLPF